jgi:GT2 family glycosyltransferase
MIPAVNIVIPNWNGLRFLSTCLNSLQRQEGRVPWQITVVDNGSIDGSVAYLQREYPDVELVCLPENKGFSAAVNAGICRSKAPWVFLLNNDTEVAPDCLHQLFASLAARPEYDFFAPKMLSYHQHDFLDGAGDGYLRGGAGYRLGTLEQDCRRYNHEGPVFGVCAGAALYRRQLFDHIGLFDEDFFAYLEDVDMNLRLTRAGYKAWYVPTARVYHIGSATSGSRFTPLTLRLSTRNSFFLLLKHYSAATLFRLLPVILIYQGAWLLFTLKKGHLRAYCQGLYQACTGAQTMWQKRSALRALDRLKQAEWLQTLRTAEASVVDSIMHRRRQEGKGNTLLSLYRLLFLGPGQKNR